MSTSSRPSRRAHLLVPLLGALLASLALTAVTAATPSPAGAATAPAARVAAPAAAAVTLTARNRPGRLDERCRTGRVLCIDKSSRTLRWMVDGRARTTVDVRFGATSTPTREGSFRVERKSRDHVSTIYHSAMPYAMFFSRGQAVHFSSDFAARGYRGASHGCVNVRDRRAVARIFDQVRVGDRVVVYRS